MAENNEDLDLEQQYALYGNRYNAQGRANNTFLDPSTQYPKYDNEPSVNRAARGDEINNLDIKLGQPGVPDDVLQKIGSQYQRVKIDETPSGHVFELNDTPGGERILMKHNTGAGYDIRPDGAVVLNSKQDTVHVVGADYHMSIGGDGKMTIYGNLDLNVTGDMNMTVGGNFIFKVKGSVVADVIGNVTKKVVGNVRETVKGIYQSMRLGKTLQITLGGFSNYVKGNFKQIIHGTGSYNHKSAVSFTSETEMDMAGNSVNLAARSMSVFGDTGTIGGDNIIMYNYNMHTKKTVHSETVSSTAMYATTFHGDLTGTSNAAKRAAVAGGLGGGGVPGLTNNRTAVDNTATALPTGALLNDYLDGSNHGVKKVSVDEDDGLAKTIDFSDTNGGVIDRELDPREVKARMKDPANFNNSDFTANQIAAGNLKPDFANSAPPPISRVVTTNDTTSVGETGIGPERSFTDKRFTQSPGSVKGGTSVFLPDPQYNPNNFTEIKANTKLSRDIRIARFLGGYGDASNLNHITDLETKKQLSRNLLQHVNIFQTFEALKSFNGFTLIVAEGLYKPYDSETITPDSVLDYRTDGRGIIYEVWENATGKESFDKLFEFAEILKNSIQYDEISLRYDNFDPRQADAQAQLLVVFPEVPSNYSISFKRQLSTYYNEKPQSVDALIEFEKTI